MPNRKSMEEGEVHGELTFTKELPYKDRHVKGVFKCSCGNEKVIPLTYVRNNIIRSCGCLRKKLNKTPEKATYIKIYTDYKNKAKIRNIDFHLSSDDIENYAIKNCYYCGVEPSNIYKNRGIELNYNGIDRIDSTKGYTLDNTVPCCKICNYAKNNMSTDSFKNWIVKVYQRLEEF